MDVWVKICGVTRPDDARAAFEVGADAIGLNFIGGPRRITVAAAEAILENVPADRVAVGLVALGPSGVEPAVDELLETFGVLHVQVYGDISPANVGRLLERGRQPLVVCRGKTGALRSSLEGAVAGLAIEDLFALVLDAVAPGKQGGTGKTLDWDALAEARRRGEFSGLPPIVLAGGLTAENVARAVEIVRPWGVDVASGVESSPGRKDHRALAEFVRAAKNVS